MIYYITGGERSGKSSWTQRKALELSDNPIYLATARVWDGDFAKRIERHKNERGEEWTTIEEEKHLSTLDLKDRVVVLDCVTLWLNNFFADAEYDVQEALTQAKAEFDKLIQQQFTLLVISNEIGMGVHADSPGARKFVELQGWMNQYIAAKADKAILMVSGIAVEIK